MRAMAISRDITHAHRCLRSRLESGVCSRTAHAPDGLRARRRHRDPPAARARACPRATSTAPSASWPTALPAIADRSTGSPELRGARPRLADALPPDALPGDDLRLPRLQRARATRACSSSARAAARSRAGSASTAARCTRSRATSRRARVARAALRRPGGVHVYAANYSALDERAAFDVVTLIGVLEYGHLYHPDHRGDPRGGGARQPADRAPGAARRRRARAGDRERARPEVPQRRARGPLGAAVRLDPGLPRPHRAGHVLPARAGRPARRRRLRRDAAGTSPTRTTSSPRRSSTPRPPRTTRTCTTGSTLRRPTAAPRAGRCCSTSGSPSAP